MVLPADLVDSSSETSTQEIKKPVRRVALSGGGGRGVVYSGAFRAMVETGLYRGLHHISGASAGSLAGALMACGMSVGHFRALFNETNLKSMLGDVVEDTNRPGVRFFTRDGRPLLQTLRYHIRQSIRRYITEHYDEITPEDQLDTVLEKIDNPASRYTFADLASLHRKWPRVFKKFTTLAVEHPSGVPQVFSSDQTPHVEIALACRASSSLPVILQPVPVSVEYDGAPVRYFVDAGLYDNIPTDYFDKPDDNYLPNTMKDQTLVFAFGEDGIDHINPVHEALYGSRIDEARQDDSLKPRLYHARMLDQLTCDTFVTHAGAFQADYKNTEQAEIGFHNLRSNYPLRTIELNVHFLKSTDFDKATKYSRIADTVGYFDTVNHLINHDLYEDSLFNPDEFYADVVSYFLPVYRAVLRGAGKEVAATKLSRAVKKYDYEVKYQCVEPAIYNRELAYLIQQHAFESASSIEAFALSRAMEFRAGIIDANQLAKETYLEAFRRGSLFGRSQISGKNIFAHADLMASLSGKSMFELFEQVPKKPSSRAGKVMAELRFLPSFISDSVAAESQSDGIQQSSQCSSSC